MGSNQGPPDYETHCFDFHLVAFSILCSHYQLFMVFYFVFICILFTFKRPFVVLINSKPMSHKTLQRYNKELKAIAEICGIDKTITSYVARHSFANCLKQKGVATDIISESMGHQNLNITQTYLKEFDNSVLDKAIEILV